MTCIFEQTKRFTHSLLWGLLQGTGRFQETRTLKTYISVLDYKVTLNITDWRNIKCAGRIFRRFHILQCAYNDEGGIKSPGCREISMPPSLGGTDIKQVGERAHLPPWLRWGGAAIGRECHVWEINGVTGASREARHADSSAMNIYSLALLCVCGRPSTASPLLVLTHTASHVCRCQNVCVGLNNRLVEIL